MQKLKLGLAVLLLALIVVFVAQNLGTVKIRFLTWKWHLPVALPVIVAYAVGGFSGRFVYRFFNRRRLERHQDNVATKIVDKVVTDDAANSAPIG